MSRILVHLQLASYGLTLQGLEGSNFSPFLPGVLGFMSSVRPLCALSKMHRKNDVPKGVMSRHMRIAWMLWLGL